MKIEKIKCLWCEKLFNQKKWVAEKGKLKGFNMVSSVCCSSRCSKKLHYSLQLSCLLEDLDETRDDLQKDFNKLYDSRKKLK